MAQRRIELQTLRKAYRELHRNAECDTITSLNRSKTSPIFLLDGQKERNGPSEIQTPVPPLFQFPTSYANKVPYRYATGPCPVRGAQKRNGKEGWLDGGLNSGLPAKDALVQEPWQDALQLHHRVVNTKRPERMERELRVIKKGGSRIGGELGPDMECPRLGPTSPGCGIGA
ncbi:hypothetical protein FB451DRAFT_1169609 [Mycena latifolia]|nr:hypothetical protein FB451DRAFT_1169609 [Mycena latifolia]